MAFAKERKAIRQILEFLVNRGGYSELGTLLFDFDQDDRTPDVGDKFHWMMDFVIGPLVEGGMIYKDQEYYRISDKGRELLKKMSSQDQSVITQKGETQ